MQKCANSYNAFDAFIPDSDDFDFARRIIGQPDLRDVRAFMKESQRLSPLRLAEGCALSNGAQDRSFIHHARPGDDGCAVLRPRSKAVVYSGQSVNSPSRVWLIRELLVMAAISACGIKSAAASAGQSSPPLDFSRCPIAAPRPDRVAG